MCSCPLSRDRPRRRHTGGRAPRSVDRRARREATAAGWPAAARPPIPETVWCAAGSRTSALRSSQCPGAAVFAFDDESVELVRADQEAACDGWPPEVSTVDAADAVLEPREEFLRG